MLLRCDHSPELWRVADAVGSVQPHLPAVLRADQPLAHRRPGGLTVGLDWRCVAPATHTAPAAHLQGMPVGPLHSVLVSANRPADHALHHAVPLGKVIETYHAVQSGPGRAACHGGFVEHLNAAVYVLRAVPGHWMCGQLLGLQNRLFFARALLAGHHRRNQQSARPHRPNLGHQPQHVVASAGTSCRTDPKTIASSFLRCANTIPAIDQVFGSCSKSANTLRRGGLLGAATTAGKLPQS